MHLTRNHPRLEEENLAYTYTGLAIMFTIQIIDNLSRGYNLSRSTYMAATCSGFLPFSSKFLVYTITKPTFRRETWTLFVCNGFKRASGTQHQVPALQAAWQQAMLKARRKQSIAKELKEKKNETNKQLDSTIEPGTDSKYGRNAVKN